MACTFRMAKEDDVDLILFFIKSIAKYEKLENEVVATKKVLHYWFFEKKTVECMFILEDGKEIGYAVFFHNFSTFLGRAGLYLEDIYILPEYRHKGYGKETFKKLAQIAVERGCGRMEWVCLKWNTPSQKFYESLGAYSLDKDWMLYRLTEDKIKKLAEED